MIKNYFKIAIRQLFKNKLFSALNIFGFATSLAVCLLLITILNDQYSYDNFHENGDEIYRVISSRKENAQVLHQPDLATTSLQIREELKDKYPFIKSTVRLANMNGIFLKGEKILANDKSGFAVDKEFLNIFSFGWSQGNKSAALQEPNSIVLTEEFVDLHFFGENPIGSFLELEDVGEFKITGIIPTPPIRSHIRFDFLMSFATIDAMPEDQQRSMNMDGYYNVWRGLVYLLLDKKESQTSLDDALAKIGKEYSLRDGHHQYLFKSQALTEVMPSNDLGNEIGVGTPKMVLSFLIVLGIIIMLAACFNYMNLSVARSLKRAKEIGIRKVAGAGKRDIVIQFLSEAILISFLSFLVAVILLELLIPAFYGLDPFVEDVFYLKKSPKLYLIFLGFSLFVGLFAGIFPAFNISRFKPIQSIQKLSNVKMFSRIGFRKSLVTFQFALSLIFILTVIIVMQQQKKIMTADLGIRIDNMLNVWMGDDVNYEVFAQKVEQIKGVESISASWSAMLIGGLANTKATFNNQADSMMLAYNFVSPNFINNMEIKLLAGENFPKNNHSKGEQFVLLNEKATQRMGFQSPDEALGQSILIDTIALTVLGVTQDFHHDNIWFGKIEPYGLRQGNDMALANIRLDETNTSETILAINKTWDELSPQKGIHSFFIDERAYHLSKFFKMGSKIIGFVGFLTILISCLGLLGMVIYTIEGRLKEVGIRKVLGASEGNLNWQLAKGFLFLLSIAILIAVPLTVFLSNLWLQNFLIRINISFGMILTGVGIILFLAFITILSQTRLAAQMNPSDVLKNE